MESGRADLARVRIISLVMPAIRSKKYLLFIDFRSARQLTIRISFVSFDRLMEIPDFLNNL